MKARIFHQTILDSNNHSVFLMWFHLVFVTKYWRKVISGMVSMRLKGIFVSIANGYNISLQEWNHEPDHVHILRRGHPNSNLSKFVNAYKSASSRLVKKEFPEIRNTLWKEYFWSQSFCLLTSGGAPIEIIREYIRTQGAE